MATLKVVLAAQIPVRQASSGTIAEITAVSMNPTLSRIFVSTLALAISAEKIPRMKTRQVHP